MKSKNKKSGRILVSIQEPEWVKNLVNEMNSYSNALIEYEDTWSAEHPIDLSVKNLKDNNLVDWMILSTHTDLIIQDLVGLAIRLKKVIAPAALMGVTKWVNKIDSRKSKHKQQRLENSLKQINYQLSGINIPAVKIARKEMKTMLLQLTN